MKITPGLKKRLLFLFPFSLIFCIADKLGFVYRLSAGTGAVKLSNTVRNLPHLFDFPPISIHGMDLLFAVIVSAALLLVLYAKRKNAKKQTHVEESFQAQAYQPVADFSADAGYGVPDHPG